MLPSGTRFEADAARSALADENATLVMCLASAHPRGQSIAGDVVVIGQGAQGIEADVIGTVRRYPSIGALQKSNAAPAKARQPAAAPKEPPADDTSPSRAATPSAKVPPRDDLDDMNRVELIKHAADKFPGARQWVSLTNDLLRAALRELRSGD
jgi:hypothetical protein